MSLVPVIETPRATLALWRDVDDARLREFLPGVELARENERFFEDGLQRFAMHIAGELVGACGLLKHHFANPVRGPELELWLTAPGVSAAVLTEVGAHLLAYAFNALGASRVIARSDDGLDASVLAQLRFVPAEEGIVARERPRVALGRVVARVQKDGLFDLAGNALDVDHEFPTGSVVELEVGETSRVVRVVARAGSARAHLYDIAAAHALSPAFPDAVTREVHARLAAPGISLGEGDALEDLTSLPFVTIDNEDSRDLDQALFIDDDLDEPGGFRVFYALADAAFFAPKGSATFREALSRGATFYLPGLAIPMLPPALSEGLCSLNPGVHRRALVFSIRVDERGDVRQTRLFRARIRSRQKLSYNQVQRFYDDKAHSALSRRSFASSLERFQDVGKLRAARAKERDVVRYTRHEVRVGYGDQEGMTFNIASEPRNDCELYNEQISLLCNIEGARFFLRAPEQTAQPIFRNHDAPPAARLAGFRRFLDKLRDSHDLDERWSWHPTQALADFLEGLPRNDERERRLNIAVQRQAMVVNVRSEFEELPTGHFGIGAEAYARFSSPMREVVGIFTHAEALEVMRGHKASEVDAQQRREIIKRANAAKDLQKQLSKESDRLAIDALFRRDQKLPREQRPTRRGTLLGVTGHKMYVQLDEPTIEVKVYLKVAEDGPYELIDDKSAVLRQDGSMFRVGDALDLVLGGESEHDGRRVWRLDPVSNKKGSRHELR